jgi:predicted alpha-1,6-mannanase (GH76 family)
MYGIMKNILLILTSVLLAAGCGQVDDIFYPRPMGDTEDSGDTPDNPTDPGQTYWANAADSATGRLLSAFWNGTNNYFRMAFTPPGTQATGFQYWPQAHALDVVIDAYVRTGDTQYSDYYSLWFEGVQRGNSNRWKNDYVDDMEWIALTMVRMYETTQNVLYLNTAKQIYDDWIITQWTETPGGGGILWNTTQSSKNACSNGPAGVLACRLAELVTDPTEKEKYKNDAARIYNWVKNVLMNDDGDVYDNIASSGAINKVVLSYNMGTVMGTAHGLYKLTGTKSYLDDAVRIANRTTTNGGTMDQATGCLRSEGPGTGDNGLFKGIFIRYFVKLINDTNVDKAKRQQFYNFMVHNATTLWTRGTHKEGDYYAFFGDNWATAITQAGAVGMQGHVSGCTLLEAMNVLQPVE